MFDFHIEFYVFFIDLNVIYIDYIEYPIDVIDFIIVCGFVYGWGEVGTDFSAYPNYASVLKWVQTPKCSTILLKQFLVIFYGR